VQINRDLKRLLERAKSGKSIVLGSRRKVIIANYAIDFGSTGGRYARRFGSRDEIELVIPRESLSIIGLSIMNFSLDYENCRLIVNGGKGLVNRLIFDVTESSSSLCRTKLTGVSWSPSDDFYMFLEPNVRVSAFLHQNEDDLTENDLDISGTRVSLASLGATLLNASTMGEEFVRFAEPKFSIFRKAIAFPLMSDSCDLIISVCEPYDQCKGTSA
jgi:hypothetical protein